jgi:hypothetical protein
MKSGKFASRRLALTCVAAAGVLGALSFQQAFAGAAEDAAAAPDAAARAVWREAMSHNAESGWDASPRPIPAMFGNRQHARSCIRNCAVPQNLRLVTCKSPAMVTIT